MVDLKEAINEAKDFARSVFEYSLTSVAIEEVEKSENEKHWLITLSWKDPAPNRTLTPIETISGIHPEAKIYKKFYVNVDDGKVVKMERG